MLLVGFGHKARQGKDYAVAHLVNAYKDRYDIRRYSFGDELKAEFFDLLLEPLHEYWYTVGALYANVSYLSLPHPSGQVFLSGAGPSFTAKLAWIEEHKTELGNHLQIYATEYVRLKDNFHWVRLVRNRLVEDNPQVALISDVRFKNEFYFVKALQGFTVKVSREGFVLNDGRSAQHLSEVDLDDAKFDFEINVLDGEVEQLKRDAETVFEMIVDSVCVKPLDGELVANQEVAA